jgi:hypothetical protein
MSGAGIYLAGAGRADYSPLMELGGKRFLWAGWGRGVFAISPACLRCSRIANNRRTPASHFYG